MTHRLAFPIAAAMAAALAASAVTRPAQAESDLAATCARVGNDDFVRPYSPSLRAGTAQAFKTLFPGAGAAPDPALVEAQANYRCMNGKIFVCFTGANLPCAKIGAARDNRGADAFCKDTPSADVVPAFATGHDAGYSYRCRGGHAVVTRANWRLDARGFAAKLWTPLAGR